MAIISNVVSPQSKLTVGSYPSLSQLQTQNSNLASGNLAGLSKTVAFAPLSTPSTNLPTGTQPGGLMSVGSYNTGVKSGLIAPATNPTQTSTPMLPKAPVAPMAGLTQEQLNAQNAATGQTQYNTGPAQVGGPVGSQPVPQATAPTRGIFPDVLSSLAYGAAARNAPIAEKAQGIADQAGQEIADIGKKTAQARGGYLTTGTSPVATGNAAIIAQTGAQQQQAVAQGAQAELQGLDRALTASGQTTSAQGTAGGLVPEALRYGGIGGGGSLDPNTVATTYANDVISGARTYNDALSAMGLYGDAGRQFLDNAIRARNPNFNFAQAQALAATQGTVAPNLNMANQAIQNLQTTFQNTPWYQKFGVPLFNSFSNMLAGFGVGTGSETAKQNAIKEARTNVSNALGTMTNTTPTAWTATVEGWFPDNATPAQIEAGVQQFANLAGYRQQIFGTPGNVQPYNSGTTNTGATGGGLYSW